MQLQRPREAEMMIKPRQTAEGGYSATRAYRRPARERQRSAAWASDRALLPQPRLYQDQAKARVLLPLPSRARLRPRAPNIARNSDFSNVFIGRHVRRSRPCWAQTPTRIIATTSTSISPSGVTTTAIVADQTVPQFSLPRASISRILDANQATVGPIVKTTRRSC